MALALSLNFSAVPIAVPVCVRDFDIGGEFWVKLRLIPTESWVGAVSWAFVSLPKIKFELSLFRLFILMSMHAIVCATLLFLFATYMPNFLILRLISVARRIERKNRVGTLNEFFLAENTLNEFNLLNAT